MLVDVLRSCSIIVAHSEIVENSFNFTQTRTTHLWECSWLEEVRARGEDETHYARIGITFYITDRVEGQPSTSFAHPRLHTNHEYVLLSFLFGCQRVASRSVCTVDYAVV